MIGDAPDLFTIGHSNQPLEQFMSLLAQHEIALLADVRRFPGSRKYPHFGRDSLQSAATAQGSEYRWLEHLGGRRSAISAVDTSINAGLRSQSFHNYADYMLTAEFQQAFAELANLARGKRTAIMCSESVFWRCHRRLISDYALASNIPVWHIFPDGRLRSHALTDGAVTQPGVVPQVKYPLSPEDA